MFDDWNSLVHIDGSFIPDRYVTDVTELNVSPLFLGAPKVVLQQDNVRQQVARRILNSLSRYDILLWPADSLDLKPIDQLLDLIERDINRGPLAETMDDLHRAVQVAWQKSHQAPINELIDSMPRRI